MSILTLNAIALLVFGVTLLSLLGPLVHISATTPALLAGSGLGLWAVDNLIWKGQGATLLSDWLAQRSPTYRDRLIHHEAGHFLVAHVLQIPITGYSLSAWQALRQGYRGQGGVRFEDPLLNHQLAQGHLTKAVADRYLQVWMAGGVAEKQFFNTVEGAIEDVQKVRTLLMGLNYPRSQWESQERWAAGQAADLLQRYRVEYRQLVDLLRRGAPLEECLAILPVPGTSL